MNRVTDDLISRAVAIEAVYYKPSHKMAIEVLKEVPTVDAVPIVHGRWIKMTGMMPPEYHGHYECSECGWHMKGLRNSWTREEELNYCPNCGAKMETKNE